MSKLNKRFFMCILLVFVLAFPSFAAAAKQSGELTIQIKRDNGVADHYRGMQKNGVLYVSMSSIAYQFGLKETYRVGSKTYESLYNVKVNAKSDVYGKFTGWDKDVVFRAGKKTVRVDGKYVTMKAAPFVAQGEFFAPLTSVFDAFKITTSYDKKTQVYKVTSVPSYAFTGETFANKTYMVHHGTGKVYVTDKSGKRKLITTLNEPIHKFASITFKKTPKGHLILSIEDHYGEPSLNANKHTLLLKNDKLIHKTLASYWQRVEDNVTLAGSNIIMTDGKKAHIINDSNGKIVKTLDLVALGGADDKYFVQWVTDKYAIIRPMKKGLLTLVNLETKEKILLYKEFFSVEDQEYAEKNDAPYPGEHLQFVKQEGNTLYFKNTSNEKTDKTLYSYKLGESLQ